MIDSVTEPANILAFDHHIIDHSDDALIAPVAILLTVTAQGGWFDEGRGAG
jgi:hypothetical protein